MSGAVKRKPIRFSDISESAEDVETRHFTYSAGVATNTGQVPVTFSCPFCSSTVSTWLWSLCGGGKRCGGCKALCSGYGTAIQWKEGA